MMFCMVGSGRFRCICLGFCTETGEYKSVVLFYSDVIRVCMIDHNLEIAIKFLN